MSVLDLLNKEHSKNNTLNIVNYVKDDDKRLNELMNIFLYGEYRLAQRASWAVGILGEKTELITPYYSEMIQNLKQEDLHGAIKRNTVRAWQFMDIPERHLGEVTDLCFNFLANKGEAIAIKVFSMTVLAKVAARIPELKNELKFMIEEQMPYASAGFKSRGKKILAKL